MGDGRRGAGGGRACCCQWCFWGCFVVGAVWLAFLQEANKAIDEVWEFACEATTRGKRRHEMAMTIAMTFFSTGVLLQPPRAQPIPVLVEEDDEFPPSR